MKNIFVHAVALTSLALSSGACQAVRAEPSEQLVANHTTPEPITDEPAPPRGGDPGQASRFASYDVGPDEQTLSRGELSPEQQAVADGARNLDAAALEAYCRAAVQQALRVTSEVAARQLGIEHLKNLGVVP